MALLVSTVAGRILVNFATANPILPPYLANPIIIMESPTNRTYNINTLSLEVTFKTLLTEYDKHSSNTIKTRALFSYALDGEHPENITITRFTVPDNLGSEIIFEGSGRLPDLTEGLHKLTVYAEFEYPFYWTAKSESTVYFRIDLVPQNIYVLAPENSSFLPADVPLQFSVDGSPSWVGYSLNGQENVTVSGNMTFPELSVGQHTLTLYANDEVGNPATSQTISFSVAEPFPTTLVIVGSGASVAVVAIGLLVYFKKRKRGTANI